MKQILILFLIFISFNINAQKSKRINIGHARYEVLPNYRVKGLTQFDTCYDGKNYKSILKSDSYDILFKARDKFWNDSRIKVFAACSGNHEYIFHYYVKPVLKP